MNIWHIDKTDQGLSGIAKSLKSALTNSTTLQACASHHTCHKNKRIAPLERWQGI